MILHFPNLDTLRLALTTGAVPPTVSLTAAVAGYGAHGQVWVQPSKPLPQGAVTDLRQLGVHVHKTATVPLDQTVTCWPQLLPVAPDLAAGNQAEKTPVLFELSEAQLPEVVNEILRLGNDRQGFRRLGEDDQARVLLRVIGPPYYSLLRALDHDGQDAAPVAYLDRKSTRLNSSHLGISY